VKKANQWFQPELTLHIRSKIVMPALTRVKHFQMCLNCHLQFLGAKSTSILDCVGLSVCPSVPHDARLRGKIIFTRLIREEEEEEETDYVAIPLRRVLRT
jgi:hypothetical protein